MTGRIREGKKPRPRIVFTRAAIAELDGLDRREPADPPGASLERWAARLPYRLVEGLGVVLMHELAVRNRKLDRLGTFPLKTKPIFTCEEVARAIGEAAREIGYPFAALAQARREDKEYARGDLGDPFGGADGAELADVIKVDP